MFKGLKNKLEDEAKRLQATVTQYGENIAQQVRAQSDTGSEVSGYAKRLFSAQGNNTASSSSKPAELLNDTLVSLDDEDSNLPDGSALMKGIDESDVEAERVRRLSGGSIDSTDSSLSALFFSPNSASAHRMDTIPSDVESNSGSIIEPTSFDEAPSSQKMSILQSLQGRASNYKDKYRELVKTYNEVVRENEKCRTVLATTQDKALQRIEKLRKEKKELTEKLKQAHSEAETSSRTSESADSAKVKKLQELLEKCKENIKANKEKITQLTVENATLKTKLEGASDDQEMSDLAVQRVTAEWKGRVDRLEEEWTQRLSAAEEKAAIAIATSKAEMHSALEGKDKDIEMWIQKCHNLEKQDSDANVRWQQKVDQLHSTITALEAEKADMIEKLSHAKQEGVKLVKEEEEKKRDALEVEFKDKLKDELDKQDEEWRRKLAEVEEQMQLAIEEREMQKVAAITEYDRRADEQLASMEEMTTEKLRLETEIDDIRAKQKMQIKELTDSIEGNTARHREEVSALQQQHDALLASLNREKEEALVRQQEMEVQLQSSQSNESQGADSQASEHNVQQCREQLKSYRHQCDSLRSELTNMRQQLRNEQQSFSEFLSSDLQKPLLDWVYENERSDASERSAVEFEAQLSESSALVDQLKAQNMQLQEELEQLKNGAAADIAKVQKELEEAQHTLNAVNTEKDRLAISDSQDASQLTTLTKQLEDLRAENNELSELLDQERQRLEHEASLREESVATVQLEQKKSESVLQDKLTSLATLLEEKEQQVREKESLFEQRIERLTAQLAQKEEDLAATERGWQEAEQRLREETARLQKELKETEKNAAELVKEVSRLTEVNQKQVEKLTETRGLLDGARREMASNTLSDDDRQKLENYQKVVHQQQGEMMLLEARVAQMHHAEAISSGIVDELRDQRDDFSRQLSAAKKKLDEYEETETELMKSLAESTRQKDEWQQQLETTRKHCKEQKSELTRLHDRVSRANEELKNSSNLLSELKAESSGLLQQLSQAQEKNAELKASESQLRAELAEASQLREKAENDLEQSQANVAVASEALRKQLAEKEQEASMAIEQSTALKDQIREISRQHAEADKRIKELETTESRLTETVSTSTQENAALKLQVEEAQRAFEERKVELERLTSQLKDHQNKATSNEEQLADLTDQKNQLSLQLKAAQQHIKEMEASESRLKASIEALEQATHAKDSLERELEELKAHIKSLDEQAEKVAKEKQSELARLHEEGTTNVEKQTRNLRDEIKNLYAQLNTKSEDARKVQDELKALRNELEKERSERERLESEAVVNNWGDADLTADQDDIIALRDQISQLQKDKEELQRACDSNVMNTIHNVRRNDVPNGMELRDVPTRLKANGSRTYSIGEEGLDSGQVQYLRSVLLPYMMNRETLSRDTILTLCRVIGTVAKFEQQDYNAILAKEEARQHSWIGDLSPGNVAASYGPIACTANRRRVDYEKM